MSELALQGSLLDQVEEVAAEEDLEAVAALDRDEPVALVDEAPDDPQADDGTGQPRPSVIQVFRDKA